MFGDVATRFDGTINGAIALFSVGRCDAMPYQTIPFLLHFSRYTGSV
jgi:hypothetical protein